MREHDSQCWHFCAKRIGGCGRDWFHLDTSGATTLDVWLALCPDCVGAGKTVAQSKVKAAAANGADSRVAAGELAEELSETIGDDGEIREIKVGTPGRAFSMAFFDGDREPLMRLLSEENE
jgi:hypothetical protein